jgi:YHS domain-containing protein
METTMKLIPTLLVCATLAIAGTSLASAKVPPVNTDKKGVALHGYDPVTYFESDKPQRGSEAFAYSYMGATWLFVSAENRKKFAQHHDMYLPQYGGYCAKAVSEDNTADIDPLAFKIVDGKLYLNYDSKIQKIWEADIPGRIAKADKNWPGLIGAGK